LKTERQLCSLIQYTPFKIFDSSSSGRMK
jgi:hypothetical protein